VNDVNVAMGSAEKALAPESQTSLGELALLFLKLGTIAFGGPAAHIAMMEDEVVRRRQWLTREEFLDYLGATNVIPGPNSTELAIHIGLARRGWRGLLVAGVCFIVPAAIIVAVLARAYVRYGRLPEAQGILYGIKPVVIAIVLQALWALSRSAVKSRWLAALGLVAVAAVALGVNELAVLGAAAATALAREFIKRRSTRPTTSVGASVLSTRITTPMPKSGGVAIGAVGLSAVATPFSLVTLLLVFLKIGAVLFGSGYVLLAFLRADLVQGLGWLTERQLLDAVAVGQVTPGPVFTTATFIGYILGRGPGAIVATVGIFLPSFVFVAISGPLVPRIRRSPLASAALDGVNVASLALMVVVTVQLGRAALVDPLAILLGIASALLLLRFRINSAWLVMAGAAVGLFARAHWMIA
jgi:chromate transporter